MYNDPHIVCEAQEAAPNFTAVTEVTLVILEVLLYRDSALPEEGNICEDDYDTKGKGSVTRSTYKSLEGVGRQGWCSRVQCIYRSSFYPTFYLNKTLCTLIVVFVPRLQISGLELPSPQNPKIPLPRKAPEQTWGPG